MPFLASSPLRRIWPALISSLALAMAAPAASAHPHVWVDADVTLQFKDRKIEAMRVTWVFDEIFSSSAIGDFDSHHTGRLDADELKRLVAQSSKSLRNYSYFTYLDMGGKRQRVTAVEDFTAELKNKRLIYHFSVPVNPAVDPQQQPFGFLLYDETYYVDIGLTDGHKVAFAGDVPQGGCGEERKQDSATPLYFGTAFPTLIRITCR
jgi:ABC-type uncharacterized transport system substrate-binding protein